METREARSLLDGVEHELQAFAEWWRSRVVWSSMYRLPQLASTENLPDLIEVEPVAGTAAAALAAQALAQLRYEPDQHHATALRFPGLVALDGDPTPYLARINAAKKRLEESLQDALDGLNSMARAQRYKDLLPGVSILQATRQVGGLDAPPYSFGFTWISKTISRKLLTADEAVALLEAQGAPASFSKAEWRALVDAKIGNIRSLPPGATILRHRELAPHPRLLAILSKGQRPPLTFRASLPVFFPLPSGNAADLPRITPLQSFDRTMQRPERRKQNTAVRRELVPELKLYYLEPD